MPTSPLLAYLLLLASPDATAVQADVVIRGATLYDGTDQQGKVGDLAIRGERIVAVGNFPVAGRPRMIDAAGLIVAPGFIDLHTHSDVPLTQLATKANLCYLLQGVTTVVTGNCGTGPADVAAYFRKLETGGIGSNVIHQIPHNDVRRQVMGNANRVPSAEELRKLEGLVERGMKEGAWGLSTGLYYNPGAYAKTQELIALARVAGRHGGFYASHMRDEGTGLLASVEEVIRIGREAKLPVHISHLKAFGPKAWGKTADAIALIQHARAEGLTVTADQYPYTASSTALAAELIPPQFREGNPREYLARLNDPEQGRRIRQAIADRVDELQAGTKIRIDRCAFYRAWQGKTLQTIAAAEKKEVPDLVMDIERRGGAHIVNFSMSDEDVRLVMRQPFVATGSDGGSMVPDHTMPHPRSYGCFARKIGRLAIEEKLLPLEQAIRSATGLPADILRLPERGYLKPGYHADVVVFDPLAYRDQATFDKPHQFATGMRYVLIDGKFVVKEGKYTGLLVGKVLRHRTS